MSFQNGLGLPDLGEKDAISPIAIVGMGCRFPGEATSPAAFFEMLSRGRAAWSEVPQDRYNMERYWHPDNARAGTMTAKGGHFLKEDLGLFDAPFFSLTAAEATALDPQLRILLEVSYECLENAGIPMEKVMASDTSCYVGCSSKDYDALQAREIDDTPLYQAIGGGYAMLSSRLSHFYNLNGPCLSLDTACSSGLVALHLGCQSIRSGESRMSLIGATQMILSPDMPASLSSLHMLSPDSRCYSFDERANGYARGEGICVMALKPLEDALRDGDTIRAVIRGTGTNQDGRTPGITVPSMDAQASMIRSVYRNAGLDYANTQYFEAHGTGTPVGDPLELGALGATFGSSPRVAGQKLYVGSVKTNIGHLEGCAGLAGLLKTILCLENGVIVPSLNYEKPNPKLRLDEWKLKVPIETIPWPTRGLRRASVNSFGYGGSNAHCIIDDAYHYLRLRGLFGNTATIPDTSLTPDSDEHPDSGHGTMSSNSESGEETKYFPEKHDFPRLFVLSSPEQGSLQRQASLLAQHISNKITDESLDRDGFLTNLAMTLADRRSLFQWRTTFHASTAEDLVTALTQRIQSGRAGKTPKIGFVFTGQGAQWYAMGRELTAYKVYSQAINNADRAVRSFGAEWSLLEELMASEQESHVNMSKYSQPLCAAVQIALVDLLKHWGMVPSAVCGHSSGEIAAAYAAGILSAHDCMKVAYHRGRLSQGIKTIKPELDGAMLAVGLSEEATKNYLAMLAPSEVAVIACINSPSSVTVSGDSLALTKLEGLLKLDNVFARRLKVENAYHSPHMQVIADNYLEAMGKLEILEPPLDAPTMFSSVTGAQVSVNDLDAAYWVRNMTSPVQFVQAVAGLLPPETTGRRRRRDVTIDTFVEIGPHFALQGPMKQILTANGKAEQITYLSTLARGQDATDSMLDTASKLWMRGYPLIFRQLNSLALSPRPAEILTDLPSYAWNHTNKYWHETLTSQNHRLNKIPRLDLLGKPVEDFNPRDAQWKQTLRIAEMPWISHHRIQDAILYPAAGMFCAVLEGCKQLAATDKVIEGFEFRDIIIGHALIIDSDDKGVAISLHIRPRKIGTKGTDASWLEFTLFSLPKDSDSIEHCSGLIQIQYKPKDGKSNPDSEAAREWESYKDEYFMCQRNCNKTEGKEEFYAKWASRGMQYGPLFQPIDQVSTLDGVACCDLTITDTQSVMPAKFEYEHLIHPSTLDGIFQTFVAGATDCTQGMVPTSIASIYVSASLPSGAGSKLRGFSKVSRKGFRNFVGPIYMSDEAWTEPKVVVKGIFCTELGALSGQSDSDDQSTFVKKLCSQIIFKEDVDLISQENAQAALGAEDDVSSHPNGITSDLVPNLEKAARLYIRDALAILTQEDESIVAPYLAHFIQWMRHRMLLENTSAGPLDSEDDRHFLEKTAASGFDGRILSLIGENLADIIRNTPSPEFLEERDRLFSEYKVQASSLEQANKALLKWLDLQAHKRPDCEYLEISNGSALAPLALEVLGGKKQQSTPRYHQYTYTSPDTKGLEAAQKMLSQGQDKIRCKTLNLDLESGPMVQGFEKNQFDVIIAHNVLHNSKNISTTLAHCCDLLKPGGRLVVIEYTKESDHLGLIMGTSPAWWRAEDGRVGTPLADENQWHHHFDSHFSGMDLVVRDSREYGNYFASMMVTTKSGPMSSLSFSKIVLLVPPNMSFDLSRLVDSICEKLQASALEVDTATLEQAAALDDQGEIFVAGKAVVSLLEMEAPMIHDISQMDFERLHAVLLKGLGGLWVSHGSTEVDPSSDPRYSASTGLMRTLRTEKPEIRMHQLDLSANAMPSQKGLAELICQVFTTEFKAEFLSVETEVSEREGRLFIPRLYDDKEKNRDLHLRGRKRSPELQKFVQPGRPLRLEVGNPGMLDSLHFVDDIRPLAPLGEYEVEFSVQASAVNFMDVMVSMGLVADTLLGVDAAGVVERVGSAVTRVKPGDRVAGFGGYVNLVHIDEGHVEILPSDMSIEEGASLPTIVATAYQSLVEIARLENGETVLIHSAAGGVGQIAVQIAQYLGAEVFATVGSAEKRSLIRDTYGIPNDHIFNSRDLTFAKGIMRSTKGQGVDVVLNSLAGEALRQTWECIAMFGRFIEIGKKDILANSGLEMMPFLRNVTFAGVNLEHMSRNKPQMLSRILNRGFDLVRQGAMRLVKPTTVYKYSEIEQVFRLMQQGKHTGKCVLKVHPDDMVPVVPRNPHPLSLSPDATYVLVGGLGGIGRSLAELLANHGARHLAFISRSGDAKPEAKKTLADLQESGVNATSFACDTVDEAALRATVAKITTTMPPIKGLIQAAMVLKDTYFQEMTYKAWTATTRPKIQGTWNLHNTMPRDLDFFVMLASISGIVGNGSQSNYAAGNTFQDGLAHYRRAQGLAACTLDLSVMAGIGWVAENVKVSAEHKADFDRMAMDPEELYSLMESAMTGYVADEVPMPAQMVTGAGTGGTVEEMEHLKTAIHFDEAMFSYLRLLDKHGSVQEGAEAGGPAEMRAMLAAATSLVQAGEVVEVGLAGKLAKALTMKAEDIDTAKPVHGYGVDSLVAIEVRNWVFKELKSQVSVFDILSAVPMSQLAVKIAEKSTLLAPEILKQAA